MCAKAGPTLLKAADTSRAEWIVTVTASQPGGGPPLFATIQASTSGPSKCTNGTLTTRVQGACAASEAGAKSAAVSGTTSSEPFIWKLVPVDGKTGVFNVVAGDRKKVCLRYLSAAAACKSAAVELVAADDRTSGLQQWELVEVRPAPPSPAPRPPLAKGGNPFDPSFPCDSARSTSCICSAFPFVSDLPFAPAGGVTGGDAFGRAMAVSDSGRVAIVGTSGAMVRSGSALVYEKGPSGWNGGVPLLPNPLPAAGSLYGYAVAISGDGRTAVVGHPGAAIDGRANAGAAYVFVRPSRGSWSDAPGIALTLPDAGLPAAGAVYGRAVEVSQDGTVVIVGAPGANGSSGAIYVFTQSTPGSWESPRIDTLTVGSFGKLGQLGYALGVSAAADVIVAGAPWLNNFAGVVYTFVRGSDGVWGPGASLSLLETPPAGSSIGENIGVSADGFTIVVGAQNFDSFRGAAFMFKRSSAAEWTFVQELTLPAEVAATSDLKYFGDSVSMSSSAFTVVVGAPGSDSNRGRTFVFTRATGGSPWEFATELTVPADLALQPSDGFGGAVDISASGKAILAGAPGRNNFAGAAYEFGC